MAAVGAPLVPVPAVAPHPLVGPESLSSPSVSTGRGCDGVGCGRYIHELVWHQCVKCLQFDLCADCTEKERTSQAAAILAGHQLPPPICGQPLEAGSPDIVVQGHRLREITYAASQSIPHRNALGTIHQARVDQILGNGPPDPGVPVRTARDVWLLERELNQLLPGSPRAADIGAKLLAYLRTEAAKQPIKILSLDGGGVRGMLPIRVLQHLIAQLGNLFVGCPPWPANAFPQIGAAPLAQRNFARRFQYIAGTSNGGLLGYALATDVPLATLQALYTDAMYFRPSHYNQGGRAQSWRSWSSWKAWAAGFVPWIPEWVVAASNLQTPASGFHWDRAKYDSAPICAVIDGILLGQFPPALYPNPPTMMATWIVC